MRSQRPLEKVASTCPPTKCTFLSWVIKLSLPQHSSRLSLTSHHPIPPRHGFTRQRCRLRSLWPRVFDSCRKGPQHIVVYHHTHRQGAGKGGITRYFLPVKIVNRTCDIFLLLPAFLFFCCVRVADQNTRALLLHAYCYCLATRRLAVTHHPTYTQHEKREAKEKWQQSGNPLK